MSRNIFLQSAGALLSSFAAVAAHAQEALPEIEIAGAGAATETRSAPPAKETGYTRSKASSGKTEIPILDTPRSIVVVPRELLQDNQVINTQEAVKFVSGVQTASGLYDGYQIRGFSNGGLNGHTFRNNLKLIGLIQTEDVAFLDRVEIVKGPASMLFGRIQPGGLVNFVTKRPQEEAAYSVQEQFGSWGLSRTTVDATGPLNEEKSILFRFVGAFDRADSWVNFGRRDNGAALGALTFRPSQQLEANIQVEYYNDKSANLGNSQQTVPAMALTYAIPGYIGRPADLPRNWTQNDPGMYDNLPTTLERLLIAADWTYRFDENWKITNRFHHSRSYENRNYILFGSFNPATGAQTRYFAFNTFKPRRIWATNLDLTGAAMTGPIKHDLLVGFDYFSYRSIYTGDNPSYANPAIPAFNVFLPSYGNFPWSVVKAEYAISSGNILFRNKNDNWGYYLQDDLSYEDKIHLLLGGRFDIAYDASAEYSGVTTSFYKGGGNSACFPICDGHYNPPWKSNPTERKFSPNLGLLFKITPEYSVYSSFSQSFASSNSAAQSFDGTPFKPESAWQYEIGGKASLFDGVLTASLVGFELHRKNVLTADSAHTGYSVTAGEIRSRGVEADLSGRVSENVSLIGSYTYDDAIIIHDNTTGTGAQLGKRWPGVPRHAGNVWAKYDTAPDQSEGWSFGLGAYANGSRWGNNTNSWMMPGYLRLDAMIGYRTELLGHAVEAQLNVTNFADAKYFEAGSGNNAYYGAPRTFTGSLKMKW